MLDEDGDTIMLSVKPFTIFTGGAQGVELKAETLAREYNLEIKVLIPPCHPQCTVAHKGHYIKKVNCILHTAPYTNKKVAANKKNFAANKTRCCCK